MVVGQPSHSSSGRLSAVPARPPSPAPSRCPSEECDGYPEPTHRALWGLAPIPPPFCDEAGRLSAGPVPDPTLRSQMPARRSETVLQNHHIGLLGACPPHPLFSARAVLFTVRLREVIPPAAKPSSRPAMLMPPGPPHRSGCTPRRGVHGQALDQGRPFGPPHQTVGLSTAGAVLP